MLHRWTFRKFKTAQNSISHCAKFYSNVKTKMHTIIDTTENKAVASTINSIFLKKFKYFLLSFICNLSWNFIYLYLNHWFNRIHILSNLEWIGSYRRFLYIFVCMSFEIMYYLHTFQTSNLQSTSSICINTEKNVILMYFAGAYLPWVILGNATYCLILKGRYEKIIGNIGNEEKDIQHEITSICLISSNKCHMH